MWTFPCCFCCTFVVIFNSVNAASTCHNGWILRGDSCYWFAQNENATWTDAETRCMIFGAHLAEIQTAEEDHFILNKLRFDFSGGGDYWIGGTDVASTGQFEWVHSRELVTYTNWAPKQPSGGQHCMVLWGNKMYLWDDDYCSETKHFVCEDELGAGIIG